MSVCYRILDTHVFERALSSPHHHHHSDNLLDLILVGYFVEGKDEDRIVGISLSSESHCSDTSYDVSLGAVLVPPSLTLTKLRSQVCLQLVTLPSNFYFISPRG